MPHFDTPWAQIATILAGATIASYVVGFAVYRGLLHLGVMDRPNERSSHTAPTPRGGGIGIMLVIWIGAACLLMGKQRVVTATLTIASLCLATISFLDDRYSISWRVRILVQLIASLVVCLTLVLPVATTALVLACPLFVFWIVGYANAFNFMDGINGIAAGQALMSGSGTALVAVFAGLPANHPSVILSLLTAGSAAGFLPHNFPRARMFMGDVSSVPLGFLLAVLTLWIAHERGWWLLLPLACLHANFALDTGLTVVRRWRVGQVLYHAHREHFYQRLVRAGWSHEAVTGTEMSLQIVAASFASFGALSGMRKSICCVLVVIGLWIGFFIISERCFRRSHQQ